MKIAVHALAFVFYFLGLVHYLGIGWGSAVAAVALVVGIAADLVISRLIHARRSQQQMDEEATKARPTRQSVGNSARSGGNMTFRRIRQDAQGPSDQNNVDTHGSDQSVGDQAESKDKMTFEDISQGPSESKEEGGD